jgi:phage-related protein
MAGSTDTLNTKYNSLGALISGTWRGIQVDILAPIGSALLDIANTVIPIVTSGVQALTASFAEGGGLAGVVSTIQAAFNGFRDFFAAHSGEILAFFNTTWTTIQGIIDTVIPPIQTTIETIFGAVKTFLDQHGADILATMQTVWTTIQTVVSAALDFIQTYIVPILAAIQGFISAHGAEIIAILTGVWDLIKGVVQGAMDIIQGIVNTVMALLSGDWSAAWEGIKQILSGVWTAIEGIVTGALGIITGALQIAWDAIKLAVDVVWTGIKTIISNVWDAIYLVISTGLTTIGEAIGTAWDAVTLTFSNAWDGIKEAFTNTWTALKKAVDDVLGPIQLAIETAWGAVAKTTETIFNGLKTTVTGVWNGILTALKTPINAAIDAVNMLITGASAVAEAIGFDPIPQIPRLAKGTNNFQGGLFFGGEQGPEIYKTPSGEMGVVSGGLYTAKRGTQIIPNNKAFGGASQAPAMGGIGSVIRDLTNEIRAGRSSQPGIGGAFGQAIQSVMSQALQSAAIVGAAQVPPITQILQVNGNPDAQALEGMKVTMREEGQRLIDDWISRSESLLSSGYSAEL